MIDNIPVSPIFQLYPLGDAAIVVQLGQTITPEINDRVSAFSSLLTNNPFDGLIEFVPAYTTVTVYYDPWIMSRKGEADPYQAVVDILQNLMVETPTERIRNAHKIIEIPVCYGGSFGPDLECVAEHNKLSVEDVIRIHTAEEYIVYMIGFTPGFPYLGGMNEKIATPRKAKPRATVPAGTVGIAGKQTGIYSVQTPGGWQLIGKTPEKLFDATREKPAMLQAGDRLRFIPISEEEFNMRKEEVS